jgi:hypothetical protein
MDPLLPQDDRPAGAFLSEGDPSSIACIEADLVPNLTPSWRGLSQRRNAPIGFVRADLAPSDRDGLVRADPMPDGRRPGFVRADLASGSRLHDFVRRIPPDPLATCTAILAGLGSFVTYLASINRHFGRVGFVRATPTRSSRPLAERSPRGGQCEQQQFCACKILQRRERHGNVHAQNCCFADAPAVAASDATIHAKKHAISSRARSPYRFSHPDCQRASILN